VAPLLVPMASTFHMSLAAVSGVASLYFLAYGLLPTLYGVLSDRFGRVRIIRAALVGTALADVLSALSPNLTALLVARFVTGGIACGVMPTTLVYIGDRFPFKVRQQAITNVLVFVALGTTAGTLGAGLTAHVFSWRFFFLIPGAIALAVASVLVEQRDELPGNVVFAFQPAEERASGAEELIRDGAMDDPHVDAVIGLHIWNQLPVGTVGVRPGPIFASADEIILTVRGRGGHGAVPQQNIDPIVAAAQIITAPAIDFATRLDADIAASGGELQPQSSLDGAIGATMFDLPSSEDGSLTVLLPREGLQRAPSQALLRIISRDGRRQLERGEDVDADQVGIAGVQRGMDEDAFRSAVRKLRERKEAEHQHQTEQQQQQQRTIAKDGGL